MFASVFVFDEDIDKGRVRGWGERLGIDRGPACICICVCVCICICICSLYLMS